MCLAWHEIRDHLTASSSTFSFQRSFAAIRRAQAALKPFCEPSAVLDTLHRSDGDPAKKNRILIALVDAAQGEGPASDCALTMLLLALWPGLDAIRHRLIWLRFGTADEIASDLLARTTEAVRVLNLSQVNWIAATVLRNIRRDMVRAHQRDSARERLASDADPDQVVDTGENGIGEAGYARLNSAMLKLLGDDALLVIRVAIEGHSQANVAVELGLSEPATRKRYQRAMRRLTALLEKNH